MPIWLLSSKILAHQLGRIIRTFLYTPGSVGNTYIYEWDVWMPH